MDSVLKSVNTDVVNKIAVKPDGTWRSCGGAAKKRRGAVGVKSDSLFEQWKHLFNAIAEAKAAGFIEPCLRDRRVC